MTETAKHQASFWRVPGGIVLELTERITVTALFCFFSYRIGAQAYAVAVANFHYPSLVFEALAENACLLLLLCSELLGVILILSHRGAKFFSVQPFDYAVSFAAMTLPFFAVPGPTSGSAGLWVMAFGLALQLWAKAAMWRSYGILPADRGVRSHGPYRFVRHPMYVGYSITHAGYVIAFPSLFNALLYSVIFAIQVVRVFREERILNNETEYGKYAATVRYRFLPYVI